MVALIFLLVSLNNIIKLLKEIKPVFFPKTNNTGHKPALGTVSAADGTAFSIEDLFAASVCNGGP